LGDCPFREEAWGGGKGQGQEGSDRRMYDGNGEIENIQYQWVKMTGRLRTKSRLKEKDGQE